MKKRIAFLIAVPIVIISAAMYFLFGVKEMAIIFSLLIATVISLACTFTAVFLIFDYIETVKKANDK
jgi:4-amino-4-deoxy-L-arabinose transferase-like glycosyltransferase